MRINECESENSAIIFILKLILGDDESDKEACLKSILLQDQKLEQQRRIISNLDSQIDGLLAPNLLAHFDDELFDIQKVLNYKIYL